MCTGQIPADSTMVQTKCVELQAMEFGYNLGQNVQDVSEPPVPPTGFQPMMLPNMPVLFNGNQEGVVLAGFQDCSQEAIRYLIDVEKIPEDDPLILGLKQHLWQHQQEMDITHTVTDCMPGDDKNTSQVNARTDDEESLAQSLLAHFRLPLEASSSRSDDIDMSDDYDHPTERVLGLDASESVSMESTNLGSQYPSEHSEHRGDNVSDSMLDLALLAQNNPAIASLTEEILGLLEAENQSDQPQPVHS